MAITAEFECLVDKLYRRIKEQDEQIKKLKYELHIARTSSILLKHSLDGGYD